MDNICVPLYQNVITEKKNSNYINIYMYDELE